VVDTTHDELFEPAEPWEVPGNEEDLRRYTARRLGAYVQRPRDASELPAGALADLEAVLGPLELGDVVLLPRTPRPTGVGELRWVVTPTSVLGVGERAVALWVDEPAARVVARLPFDEVAAVIDRTILLLGRLEIVGRTTSIVLRYNTVGREVVREALGELRRSFWPPTGLPSEPTGVRRETLPFKWRTLLGSADILVSGPERLIVAAGALTDPRAWSRNGVAALSATELLIATEPTGDSRRANYGVDLVMVPRSRLHGLTASGAALRVSVTVDGSPVELWIGAEATLAEAADSVLGPLIGAG
jgi:hypothetical protein